MTSPLPTQDELRAFETLLVAHARVTRELDARLRRDWALTMRDYEVLARLSRAPEPGVRMSELAESAVLTQSGMSRLVAGLERAELVERCSCRHDMRVVWARITPRGRARFDEVRGLHLADVRRLFIDPYEPAEREVLADLLERVTGGPHACGQVQHG